MNYINTSINAAVRSRLRLEISESWGEERRWALQGTPTSITKADEASSNEPLIGVLAESPKSKLPVRINSIIQYKPHKEMRAGLREARALQYRHRAMSVTEEEMKPQSRQVVVEIKRKRGIQEQGRSIWHGVDLAAAAAAIEVDHQGSPAIQPVDSISTPNDVSKKIKTQAEEYMASPQEETVAKIAEQNPAISEAPKATPKASPAKKAKAAPKRGVAKEAAKPPLEKVEAKQEAAKPKRKLHSEKERTQKLAQIETSVRRGDSVKSAVGLAGVSEQTYYHWKKNAAPTTAAAAAGDELKDLVALETENVRLKKLLAEHLRKENAELKKKLGLA